MQFTITSRGNDFEQSGQKVHGETDRGGGFEALTSLSRLLDLSVSFSSDPFSVVALRSEGADSWL